MAATTTTATTTRGCEKAVVQEPAVVAEHPVDETVAIRALVRRLREYADDRTCRRLENFSLGLEAARIASPPDSTPAVPSPSSFSAAPIFESSSATSSSSSSVSLPIRSDDGPVAMTDSDDAAVGDGGGGGDGESKEEKRTAPPPPAVAAPTRENVWNESGREHEERKKALEDAHQRRVEQAEGELRLVAESMRELANAAVERGIAPKLRAHTCCITICRWSTRTGSTRCWS